MVREQVGARVEQFLATLAQRAAAKDKTMALSDGKEPSASFRRGLVLGLGLPDDTPLVDDLSSEFFKWLVEDCQGSAKTPWGVLRGQADGITLYSTELEGPRTSTWQPARRIAYQDRAPAPPKPSPVPMGVFAFPELAAAAIAGQETGEVSEAAPMARDLDPDIDRLGLALEGIEEKFKGSL